LALALYYGLVFVPLNRRAASLDGPLQSSWRRLAASLEQTNATTLDFRHLTNQLSETRQALTILESARKKAATRLELPAALRARMSATFQLVDYQNERSKQIDLLEQAAKLQK